MSPHPHVRKENTALMFEKIDKFPDTPGRVFIFVGEQSAQAGSPLGEGDVHHNQRNQKTRGCHSNKPNDGKYVIPETVLSYRGVNAVGQSHRPQFAAANQSYLVYFDYT